MISKKSSIFLDAIL